MERGESGAGGGEAGSLGGEVGLGVWDGGLRGGKGGVGAGALGDESGAGWLEESGATIAGGRMRYDAEGGGMGWEGGRGGEASGSGNGGGEEGVRDRVSQDGEAVALLSMVLPGSKGAGRVSRCSRKETW